MRRTPCQSRSQQLVQAILIAAADVERRFGRHLASTNKIARRAGVSIGSLYQYFESKESIYDTLDRQQRCISTESSPVL